MSLIWHRILDTDEIMATTQEIEALIIESVRLLAEDFDLDALKEADSQSSLYGNDGVLDSIALVNLIADIEDSVHSKYGFSITLADEKAISAHHSPFLNIKTLTSAVMERLPL